MRRSALLALVLSPALLAQAPDRSQPPKPGPVRPFHLPAVRTFTLANGLPVTLVERHEIPVASLVLALRGGAAADPAGKAGLASLTADMLDEGAGGKDALALDDALSFLGAELTSAASWDASTVSLHVPVARLAPALALTADVVLRPEFPEKEWARIRKERLTAELEARSEPGAVASRALARAVFGEKHRYGAPSTGTAASIAAVTVADLKAFHAERYRPGAGGLFVAGDVTVEQLRPLLESAFGGWKAAPPASSALPVPPPLSRRSILLVDKPGAPQTAIRIGRVGPDRRTPSYAPIQVMNTLLGGLFTSRLNDNLRERHGWSYGAGSRFDYRRTAGLFAALADVETPHTAEALREMLGELARIGTPPAEDEAARARAFLVARFAEQFETTSELTARMAEAFVYGLPLSAYEEFLPAAASVGPRQLAEAGRAHADPKNVAIVLVGDRKAIEAPLRALKAGDVRLLTLDEVMGPAPKVE